MKTEATVESKTLSPPGPDLAGVAAVSGCATPARPTVLVVDDEPAALRVAVRGLAYFGLATLTAADGAAAVALFRLHAREIDCVLCDMTMPGMDGWATLAALRQISPDVPVVFASGYEESQIRAAGQAEQPQGFLRKPYRLEDMSQLLLQCISLARPRPAEKENRAAAPPPATTPPQT